MAVLDYVEAARLAATKESIQREKEEKERLNDVAAARWAGLAALEQAKEEQNKPWWEKTLSNFTSAVTDYVLHPPSFLSVSYNPTKPFSLKNLTIAKGASYNPLARDLWQSITYQQIAVSLEVGTTLTTNPNGYLGINASNGTISLDRGDNTSLFLQPFSLSGGWTSSSNSEKLSGDISRKLVNQTTIDIDLVGKNWCSFKYVTSTGTEITEAIHWQGTEIQRTSSSSLDVTMSVHRWPRIILGAAVAYFAWPAIVVAGTYLAGFGDKLQGLSPLFGT